VASPRSPALYSIPSHRAFADALVEGLNAQYGSDPLALARGVILVPNNRAAVAIQNAFVRRAERGLLFPRLVAVGDPELSENVGSALDPIGDDLIPPSIDPLQRQIILAHLLQRTDPALDGGQAMRLAKDLARVLDQLTVERVSPAKLRDFDPEGLALHWEVSLKTLSVILDQWPKELERLRCIDLADRRNRQLERVAKRWRTTAPSGFVIAAGISTSAPAIADLLKVVARMEHGQVVFAGLDLTMAPEEWDAIRGDEDHPPIETHPQHHLCQLLDRIGASRTEVLPWRWGKDDKSKATRADRVSFAMAPAAYTHKWVGLKPAERVLTGVSALELATPAEEAMSIALAMREAIDVPERTAALVTPDRELAERVSALLKRWDVSADDSAGRPLSTTIPGTFLLAIAQAATSHFAPVALLALLKHPLLQAGEERLIWLDGVRSLDLALRGPRPAAGLVGVTALLNQSGKKIEAAAKWWVEASALLGPLEQGMSGNLALSDRLRLLRETAKSLASEAVWAGEAGRQAADLIAALEEQASSTRLMVSESGFPLLLRDAMDGVAVRPAQGGHPRLFIWGLLEAKLQSADLMILGGLNEGAWPALANPDPWLAPAIRKTLGLPSLERRIGLTAHDMVGALGAKSVLLTRAKRDARAPTNPSRFWLRLETLAGGFATPPLRYDLLARALDHGKGIRAERPRQSPPVEDRPRSISVTQVDALKADPYSFYAKSMLKLTKLSAPGEEPDAKWRGTFLHEILGKWGQEDGFAKGKLLPRLLSAFDNSGLHPVIRAMWQPRFEEAIQSFEDKVEAGRAEGRVPVAAEIRGETDYFDIKLSGQFDRIDSLPDGKLAIVDYKTGNPPSATRAREGFASQLGLLGHLAEVGAFDGVRGSPAQFEYWSQARLSGKPYGYVASPLSKKKDPEEFIAEMYQHFEEACETWLLSDAPFTAKERPEYAYSDYDQLMRYDEWQGRGG
jgi:ATP-dependent helicase/nuclease subunit B